MKDRRTNNNENRKDIITGKQLRELHKLARRLHAPFHVRNPAGKAPLKGNI